MMETSQLKASTVTITNPLCQTCAKRYTCNNKTFVMCYVPEMVASDPIQDAVAKVTVSMDYSSYINNLANQISREEINGERFCQGSK